VSAQTFVHESSLKPQNLEAMPYQPLQLRPRDPRPETELESASSGLTPFIGRTTLSTTPPLAGHYSGSATLRDRGDYGLPISETLQFESLRRTLDGRVKKRLKKNGLSEEQNNIEGKQMGSEAPTSEGRTTQK